MESLACWDWRALDPVWHPLFHKPGVISSYEKEHFVAGSWPYRRKVALACFSLNPDKRLDMDSPASFTKYSRDEELMFRSDKYVPLGFVVRKSDTLVCKYAIISESVRFSVSDSVTARSKISIGFYSYGCSYFVCVYSVDGVGAEDVDGVVRYGLHVLDCVGLKKCVWIFLAVLKLNCCKDSLRDSFQPLHRFPDVASFLSLSKLRELFHHCCDLERSDDLCFRFPREVSCSLQRPAGFIGRSLERLGVIFRLPLECAVLCHLEFVEVSNSESFFSGGVVLSMKISFEF